MRAWSLIRKDPFYRREAFDAGLKAAGLDLQEGAPTFPIKPGEVLVTWNRYGDSERMADRFESFGGIVIVAENGYLNAGGGTPKFDVAEHGGPQPQHYYALSIHGHNGSGKWYPEDGPERFDRLRINLRPLRVPAEDQHVLICPNRTFGMRGFVMPGDFSARWKAETKIALAPGKRHVMVRQHPGNKRPPRELEEDLKNAYACVIWSSSAGIHALVAGIPVISVAPWWICKDASSPNWEHLKSVLKDDWERKRIASLRRLAWAQHTVEEISSGEPFRRLLRHSGQG